MPTLITLKLDTVDHRLRVTLSLGNEEQSATAEVLGWLPYPTEVLAHYHNWQMAYRHLTGASTRIIAKAVWNSAQSNPMSQLKSVCQQQAQILQHALNQWLRDQAFSPLLQAWEEYAHPQDEIRVIIRTQSQELRRLPWHLWEFCDQYPRLEIALGALNYQDPKALGQTQGRVRILAIMGYATDLDIGQDWQALKTSFPDAEIVELCRPERQRLEQTALWNQSWDILFFAGHSQTEAKTGRIIFRPDPDLPESEQSLTLGELQPYLRLAINQGLQIAVFNSCDGLGLAEELEQLDIPQTIIMREPVPDAIAQFFLQNFLQIYAETGALYVAMRQTREKLKQLEPQYPAASGLPIIVQNPAVTPPHWLALSGAIPKCPYRGLMTFEPEHQDLFFGREAEIQSLIQRIQTDPLVAIVGASGCGKSSLVRAGIIPQITAQGWNFSVLRPGNDPLASLAAVLAPMVSESEASLIEALRADPKTLEKIFNDLSQAQKHPLVLVLDQFEEVFTLTRCESDRQALLNNLQHACQTDSSAKPNIHMILTLRADFLGLFFTHQAFNQVLEAAKFELYQMPPESLRRAILSPASLRGVRLEPGLVERFLEAVSERSEELPLVEFALTQLWARMERGVLTLKSYEAIGGLAQVLAQHAETIYSQLTPSEQKLAQQLFVRLVRPGEMGRVDTRTVVARTDVSESQWQLAMQLNQADTRLVRIGSNSDIQTVELVHEALIRHWQRLQTWMNEEREFRLWQDRYVADAQVWQRQGQPEDLLLRGLRLSTAVHWQEVGKGFAPLELTYLQASLDQQDRERQAEQRQQRKARRRNQLTIWGSLTATALMTGLAGFALNQQAIAQKQRNIAETETQNATQQREEALRHKNLAEYQRQ
ncbi:MAG: AAA family ATPase, partial [Cyanobacteria bacterium P01_F01_bin.42]